MRNTYHNDMRKCAWYAKGSGVVLIRSRFTTLSCRAEIALTMAEADAGVSRPWRINHEKYVVKKSAISTGTLESAASGLIFFPVIVRLRAAFGDGRLS